MTLDQNGAQDGAANIAEGEIGRYRLERTVGEGAYGTVYRAHDPVLDRTVAIKLLNRDAAANTDPEESLREAKTLAKLNHPNIVTLYEITNADGHTAMVMEYLEGEPLRDYLARVALTFEEKIALARQIADALAASHAHHVVHADVKPGNIIVRKDGTPMVVDFGLSKVAPPANDMATLTKGSVGQNMIFGTLPYMAPEVMKGAKPDEASDIFSFGALMYELLTGEKAFGAASDAEVVHLVLNVDPAPVSAFDAGIPPWCANLVARMLSKDKAGRPLSFQDILKAMATADAGTPMRDRAAAKKASGFAVKRLMVAALLLVAALGVGFYGAQYYERETPTISSRINAGLENLRHFEKKGAIEEAKALFQSVLREDPENAAATAGYGLALLRHYSSLETDPSLLANALTSSELAITLDQQLALGHIVSAWAHEFEGNRDKANDAYLTAISLDPTNFFALEGFGRFLQSNRQTEEAIKHFQSAIKIYPDESLFHIALGDLYFLKGDYPKAQEATQKALTIAPDNIHGYKTLGAILYAQNQIIEAISVTQKGLQINPDAMLYNNLGTFYYALGQYAQSVSAFERAIDRAGNSHSYFHWANLGDAYSMVDGQEVQAQLAYKRAIQILSERIKPDDTRPGLLSRAGLYYAKAGEIHNAEKMTNRALDLAPSDRRVLFRASVVKDLADDREAALMFLSQAIDAGQPLTDIKNEPYLTKLREDPEYHKLLAKKKIN